MNIDLLHNKIIILDSSSKSFLLELLSGKLINVKIITLDELLKGYLFDYDEKTINYICKKYQVCVNVAKKYLKNMYYIDDDSSNPKIHFLYSLKQELIVNNLLLFNKSFVNYLNNKDIILYNLKLIPNLYQKIINKLSLNNHISYLNDPIQDNNKTIIGCPNKEDEISLVASKISELLLNKVDIHNIKIANVSKEYEFSLQRIFKEFQIPINLNTNYKVTGSNIIKTFINNYENNIEKTITKIKEIIKTSKDELIFKRIINILNKYNWIDNYNDIKELVIEDIKNISIPSIKYDNAVEVIDLNGYIPQENDYIFLINFNEGIIPKEYKDEDYLSDKEKELLKESTSEELNKIEQLSTLNKIKAIKNLVITYSLNNKKEDLYISSLYDNSFMEDESFNIPCSYSHPFNKNRLVASLDNYNKYGEKDEVLLKIFNSYKELPYLSYNHSFKSIERKPQRIRLSYSTMDNYFKCSFRYYLKNILKIDKQEDSFAILIGNIFHHILAHCYEDTFDLDYYWNEEIKLIEKPLLPSEKYFLNRSKGDLELLINTLKEQFSYTNLKKVLLEKNITVKINDQVTFIGFVDKIMYEQYDDKTIVSIIDYKTGNPDLNINNIIYGLDMQLPVYVFLIKNSSLFNNVIIGGFYLQKILNNYHNLDEKKKSLKLQGYSNNDINILKEVDSSFEDSNVIQGLKTTNSGFYAYSKVLDDKQIDLLSSLVQNNIEKASKNILNGKFDINPKKINDEIVGCKYCPYKDICFMDNNDVITLEPKDLFGGDNNEMD